MNKTEYRMVYRCQHDGFGLMGCGWSTENYADIDAHEDQLEPGHFVVGRVEPVEMYLIVASTPGFILDDLVERGWYDGVVNGRQVLIRPKHRAAVPVQ